MNADQIAAETARSIWAHYGFSERRTEAFAIIKTVIERAYQAGRTEGYRDYSTYRAAQASEEWTTEKVVGGITNKEFEGILYVVDGNGRKLGSMNHAEAKAVVAAHKAAIEKATENLRAKEQVLYDIHHALGIEWGDDPYHVINTLKSRTAQVSEKP